jgi:hypothetical protein
LVGSTRSPRRVAREQGCARAKPRGAVYTENPLIRSVSAETSNPNSMESWMIKMRTGTYLSALLWFHVANAQTIMDEPRYTFDVATISCKQFMDVQTDGIRLRIIYWLDGYYRGSYEPTIIDTNSQRTALVQLADYCTRNETHPVITAYKKLFVVKK